MLHITMCPIILLIFLIQSKSEPQLDAAKSQIWGPGLQPDIIVIPARYFYIEAFDSHNKRLHKSPGNVFTVNITGNSKYKHCRVWVNILDRQDGSFIVRYKMYHTCTDMKIEVKLKDVHVAASPYKIKGPVHHEECYCPVESLELWLKQYGCSESYKQIESDLKPFPSVNVTEIKKGLLEKFNQPGSISICNYAIKNNKVYRKCYGRYVGFKMFIDAILLSMTRKAILPDMEMFFNLGDWPLVHVVDRPHYPIFSWCGSDDTLDIVLPTYDITEATLECMGRVMLDMLSVQGNIEKKWSEKIEKAFWRGRDSRPERLKMIDIARENPHLINASLTNFFFYKDKEEKYGPKEKHISFFRFFDYKYQVNIDGTVAAYRFPYLLAGDSLVLKQQSKYYEFFYKHLEPWKHYVPIKSDLSDLVEKILWAQANDEKAQKIARNGQKFAQNNLMPQNIFCYHGRLFYEWSKLLIGEVIVEEDMELVEQPVSDKPYEKCSCDRLVTMKDEL